MYKKYVAIDQYGNTHFVDNPRRELCELNGVKHVQKMYRDGPTTANGNNAGIHVGYIVAGHWYEVLRLSPLHEEEK
jgi:hypothetical protein